MKRLLSMLILLTVAGVQAQDLRAGAQPGLAAPSLSVRPLNGGNGSLRQLVDPSGALIAFVNPRTAEGGRTLAFLQQSYSRLQEMEVGVVALVIGVSQPTTVQELIRENRLTVPVAHDSGSSVAERYGVISGASIVIVDPEGMVYKRYDATEADPDIGAQAIGGVRDMLEELAAEDEEEGEGEDEAAPTAAAEGAAPMPRPTDAETRSRIAKGWQLIQTGYAAAALEDARMLAEQRGEDYMATLWLAYALEAGGIYPEAAVTYRQVLALQPGNTYALKAIGRIDPDGRYRTPADLPQEVLPATGPVWDESSATSTRGTSVVGE